LEIHGECTNMKDVIKSWARRYLYDPQIFILGFLLLLIFGFIFLLGNALLPVFAGVVIAYLLDGMVIPLQRLKVPRKIAVLIVFLVFMACLLVLILALLPLLSREVGDLLQRLPAMVSSGQQELLHLADRYPEVITEDQIRQIMAFFGPQLNTLGHRLLSISMASVRGLIEFVVYIILVPLLVFFFLKDKSTIINWIKKLLPENVGLATTVWYEVNQQVSNYVRGKIWEIIILWTASYATFSLLDMDFALLVSFFVGLSVIVPYIGVAVMYLPMTLISFYQWGFSADFLYALIAYSVLQLLDGNLLAPLLLSEVVNLHPVAVISAVLVFGSIWGMWGLFFAIPLATLVHAVLKAWFQVHLRDPDGETVAKE
jgi:putative permease